MTKPLTFAGELLELNVCARGFVRVALCNRQGRPLPGFSLADCDTIRGDSIRSVVSWKGASGLGRYIGKTIRLQFELFDAKLYAFQFAAKHKP